MVGVVLLTRIFFGTGDGVGEMDVNGGRPYPDAKVRGRFAIVALRQAAAEVGGWPPPSM